VIPAPFTYRRAESTDHALSLLAEHGEDAKLLAGGQSLLPVLKMRLARPAVLVDISRLAALSYVRVEGDEVAVGAGTRHCDVVASEVLRRDVPLLACVAGLVGDRQVRHRGTLGGSLVHADPAADLPTAVLALGAGLVVEGPSGRRRVAADEFFRGYFQTAVGEDELLVEVRLPRAGSAGWAYEKFTRRTNDWAIVAVAVADGRVALGNLGETPLRAAATEQAVAAGRPPAEAASLAADGTTPVEDMNADPAFRHHLARVLTERALTTARGRQRR
jgi:aerobic carbon-monoxide dehydrogenase medium subunit